MAPGRRTLTASLVPAREPSPSRDEPPVQRKAAPADMAAWTAVAFGDFSNLPVQLRASGAPGTSDPAAVARQGTAGGSSALPHLDQIQASFGSAHDLGGVRAQVGGAATAACDALGATAYAHDGAVGFAGAPDLHTAAHEAAHVVQQRGGVHLKGAVSEVGDAYEQHADAVADRVVRGESAAPLLAGFAGGAPSGAVQRKYKPDAEIDPDKRGEPRFDDFFGGYIKVLGPVDRGRQLVEEIATGKHWIYDFTQQKYESPVAIGHEHDGEHDGEHDDVSDQEEEDGDEPILLFHGTSFEVATTLAKGVKIKAMGKGELGGGFYMTHDLNQAAHIADYYCSKEKRSTHWAVVQFTVPRALLRTLVGGRKTVTAKKFPAYYDKVKQRGNDVESPHPWTVGPIKDNTTPYIQHLFAQEGLGVLNDDQTTRAIVLTGQVGIEKGKYKGKSTSKKYDPSEDEVLEDLDNLEPPDEDVDDEQGSQGKSDEQYEYLVERVKEALAKKAPKLTKAVQRELEEAFGETSDPRIAALMKQLG